ncbi:MAG: quinol:electron acceptor oxidoreductase subunit ActD [Terracidiphilus sp.]
MPAREGTYGLLAEFDTPSDLVRAAQQARQDGWRRMDCYNPPIRLRKRLKPSASTATRFRCSR